MSGQNLEKIAAHFNLTAINKVSGLRAIKQYYLTEDHTSKETCSYFQVPHNENVKKWLFRAFPKNKGWGGKRKNSGNKKGIKFCNFCGKTTNCKCNNL